MRDTPPPASDNSYYYALVSYLPEPLGPFLYQVRSDLPGIVNPQPHITILPPRPLDLPLDALSRHAQGILDRFDAFDVELTGVSSFSGTSVLYLEVGEGSDTLHRLHAELNRDELLHAEEFEYLPHLTLSGTIREQDLPEYVRQVETVWGEYALSKRFLLSEVVLLRLTPQTSQNEWERLWSYDLNRPRAAWASTTSRR